MLQGIIGDRYERFTVGQEAFNPNSTYILTEDVSVPFPSCGDKSATSVCHACPWHSHLAQRYCEISGMHQCSS